MNPSAIPSNFNHLTFNNFPNTKIPEHIKSVEIITSFLVDKDLNKYPPQLQKNAFACLPTKLEKLIIRNPIRSIEWDFCNIINWDLLPKSLLELTIERMHICEKLLDKLPKIKRLTLINVEEVAFNMEQDIRYLQQHLIKYKQLEEYNVIMYYKLIIKYKLKIILSNGSVVSCMFNGAKM